MGGDLQLKDREFESPFGHYLCTYIFLHLQVGYCVMCCSMVGCVVCEGYDAFFIKKCTFTTKLLKVVLLAQKTR